MKTKSKPTRAAKALKRALTSKPRKPKPAAPTANGRKHNSVATPDDGIVMGLRWAPDVYDRIEAHRKSIGETSRQKVVRIAVAKLLGLDIETGKPLPVVPATK